MQFQAVLSSLKAEAKNGYSIIHAVASTNEGNFTLDRAFTDKAQANDVWASLKTLINTNCNFDVAMKSNPYQGVDGVRNIVNLYFNTITPAPIQSAEVILEDVPF
jgi:hypothetical protein